MMGDADRQKGKKTTNCNKKINLLYRVQKTKNKQKQNKIEKW